jgi:hypothetical protein
MEAESGNLVAGVNQWHKGNAQLDQWVLSLTICYESGHHHAWQMLGKSYR